MKDLTIFDFGTSKIKVSRYTFNQSESVTVYNGFINTSIGRLLSPLNFVSDKEKVMLLSDFKKQVKELILHYINEDCEIKAMATEIFRKNIELQTILVQLLETFNINLEILTPRKESILLASNFNLTKNELLVDIGGGSVNLIYNYDKLYSKCYNIGAYVLSNLFQNNNQIFSKTVCKNIDNYIKDILGDKLPHIPNTINKLILGSNQMLSFFNSISQKTSWNFMYDQSFDASIIDNLINKIFLNQKYENLFKYFEENRNFMYGADKMLLITKNLIKLYNIQTIQPTNQNISTGFAKLYFNQTLNNLNKYNTKYLDKEYWMNYSIDLANKTPKNLLKVAAILVSDNGDLICSSYSGEYPNTRWIDILISKIKKSKISYADSIYITINTLYNDNFDINTLLKNIKSKYLYIGTPDPKLNQYLEYDPILKYNNIFRYTDDLQIKIIEQNSYFFINSEQNIKLCSYYFNNRISDLILNKLFKTGFPVAKEEIQKNKTNVLLSLIISNKYYISHIESLDLVNQIITESFNEKYGKHYDYSVDTRSIHKQWKNNFIRIYNKINIKHKPLKNLNILNIGVGNGIEAIELFSECKNITFIDIAQNGLNNIKKYFNYANCIKTNASNLSDLKNNSYDIYISLRTYNSSFFDVKQSINEAYRVLKKNSLIIISIANGFLTTNNHIIPGLLIPNTEFVDIYRSINSLSFIEEQFLQVGFTKIQVYPTETEIYLTAQKL